MVHKPLHDSRIVSWSKGHYDWCIKSLSYFESQYILWLFAISNIIVPFIEVEFAKQDGLFSILNNGVDT